MFDGDGDGLIEIPLLSIEINRDISISKDISINRDISIYNRDFSINNRDISIVNRDISINVDISIIGLNVKNVLHTCLS